MSTFEERLGLRAYYLDDLAYELPLADVPERLIRMARWAASSEDREHWLKAEDACRGWLATKV